MSGSKEFCMASSFSTRMGATKAADKSKFSQTCSLLSRYLKEKGSLENLKREIVCNLDERGKHEASRPVTTMDLLPQTANSKEGLERKECPLDLNTPSKVLSPPPTAPESGVPVAADNPNPIQASRPDCDPSAAQLTMFYAGRVLVFDNLPADKAKELMLLASKGRVQNVAPAPIEENPISSTTPDRGTLPLPQQQQQNPTVVSTSSSNPTTPNPIRRPSPADGSDLPIARKNSLHRFLEKRKDRISTKAPYPAPQTPAGTTKPENSKLWLGLASPSD